MKKLIVLLFLMPFLAFAQEGIDTSASKTTVTEEVNSCVKEIYDNPDALKLLFINLVQDKDKMRQVYNELAKDPEIKELVRKVRDFIHEEGYHEKH
jgi:hypothetical protein